MFRKVADFVNRYEYESKASAKILDALTAKSLGQKVADDHRDLGRVAWHIITTYPEMMGQIGIPFEGIDASAPVPSLAEIKSAYANVSQAVLKAVKEWKDESLEEERELYGEVWKKGLALHILIVHEVHHRGQMTILMRQAGVKVPGIYGPAMEEWANFGGQPPAV